MQELNPYQLSMTNVKNRSTILLPVFYIANAGLLLLFVGLMLAN